MLIGESMPMQRLRALVEAVAPTRVPVLIEGATGSGKELVAAMLHQRSARTGSFVAFNVCALGDTMFEDSLFGHVRGAYTGAAGESLGFLREANGGTVFLDEISGLALAAQAKLLRAIETGVFRPIGSSRDAQSDFRTIAATNERLEDAVNAGRFRADLAHRLSGMILRVPSLAERAEDIPALVEHFVARSRAGKPTTVARAVIQQLQERTWPGNVRELKQVVEASLIFARDVLDVDALAVVLEQRGRAPAAGHDQGRVAARQQMVRLLMSSGWDTEVAAEKLGVHRTTVYRRMRRLGIPVPSNDAGAFASIGADVQIGDANRANATAWQ